MSEEAAEHTPFFLKPKFILGEIARSHLSSLLREFGNKCAWCDREIIRPYRLGGPIIKKTANSVTWIKDGITMSGILATVDHLNPISKGGQSDRTNLVPACRSCNNNRTKPRLSHKYEERKKFLLDRHWSNKDKTMTTINDSPKKGNNGYHC